MCFICYPDYWLHLKNSLNRRKKINTYADNAATIKMSKTAIDAMLPYLDQICGNPSILHRVGQWASEALFRLRMLQKYPEKRLYILFKKMNQKAVGTMNGGVDSIAAAWLQWSCFTAWSAKHWRKKKPRDSSMRISINSRILTAKKINLISISSIDKPQRTVIRPLQRMTAISLAAAERFRKLRKRR